MIRKKFDGLVEAWLGHISSTLVTKGDEYAYDEDRLINFKEAARMQGCTPEQALLGFVTKHLVSIYDSIKKENYRDEHYWAEKIGDVICYFILLDALLEERQT